MPPTIKEWLAILREHHASQMPEEPKIAIVARCCGVKVACIAKQRHRARTTVYHDLDRAAIVIFDATGVPRDWCLATWWVVEHRACCLTEAFAVVEGWAEISG